ncbi:MAG: enoyl-CoA hydratase/isomerase family protein [Myxococcota bacterium]
MNFETLLYGVQEGVATIKLNRPDRHNAFNEVMANELAAVWGLVERDPEVVCVIVTGVGDKAFCTGMDVADVASGEARSSGRRAREDAPWFKLTAIQNKCWKPVITAVNGMVVGGGFHFVADSDLVIAAEHATFFDTHVKVGLVAGIEPVGLTRRIPFEAVMRLALLGGSERMSAAEARDVGLVGEVVPADRLMARAEELAKKIAQHSPTALALTKRVIWEGLETGLDDAIENAWKVINDHVAHPDLNEGAVAFVEKRKPRWDPYTG